MRICEHLREYGHVRPKDGGGVGVVRAAERYYRSSPSVTLTVWNRKGKPALAVLSSIEAARVAKALLRFVTKPGKATCGGIR